jgi:imidazole glycerol-phosphate synthase subunit HisF
MLRPRIIPCLLMYEGALVKTVRFKDPKYIGDPINAVKIFNEKEADELIILDIGVTTNSLQPNFNLIAKLAAECRMPLCYGGGVTSVEQATQLVDMGVEKVAVSAAAIKRPSLIKELVSAVGSQSIVVVLDILKEKKFLSENYKLYSHNSKNVYDDDPFSLIKIFQNYGVGEIVINSIDRDGLMQGYDLDLASRVKSITKVPLTFLGGAGSLEHLEDLFNNLGIAAGAAAGSLFVFKGKYRAVLISYPTPEQKLKLY